MHPIAITLGNIRGFPDIKVNLKDRTSDPQLQWDDPTIKSPLANFRRIWRLPLRVTNLSETDALVFPKVFDQAAPITWSNVYVIPAAFNVVISEVDTSVPRVAALVNMPIAPMGKPDEVFTVDTDGSLTLLPKQTFLSHLEYSIIDTTSMSNGPRRVEIEFDPLNQWGANTFMDTFFVQAGSWEARIV